jgi:surfactin synthase thioesterase subunit
VISEARPKGTDEVEYANKVSGQIDTLLTSGVAAENIVVVGASLGAYIAVETANKLKNSNINYAILALFNQYNLNFYSK